MSRGPAHNAETSLFLVRERAAVVGAAEAALARTHGGHYESAGANSARERLEALYDRLIEAVDTRDLGGMVAYARGVARERYGDGYDLSDVQAAFNTLEEAIWSRVLADLKPEQVAEDTRTRHDDPGRRKGCSCPGIRVARHEPTRPVADLSRLFSGTAPESRRHLIAQCHLAPPPRHAPSTRVLPSLRGPDPPADTDAVTAADSMPAASTSVFRGSCRSVAGPDPCAWVLAVGSNTSISPSLTLSRDGPYTPQVYVRLTLHREGRSCLKRKSSYWAPSLG